MSYFGTDGIRGEFGVFPITPDFVLRLGFGAGRVLVRQLGSTKKRPSVIIGKDTRISGYVIEAALQAGFNAAGVDVYLLGPLPTPAIAHLVKSFHADMGVVISASHNPYQDNGVKFFSHEGKKISDELQNLINVELDSLIGEGNAGLSRLTGIKADCIGKSYRVDDAKGRYIEYCKGSFPYHLNLNSLKIVVDCANGAAYNVAPAVFRELGAKVISIHDEPNGLNINDNCGSTHVESLKQAVLEHEAHVGIAFDGDADRVIMIDHTGREIDGDHILYILATKSAQKPVGIVGTVMSNMALEVALQQNDIPFVRAKVGDRYVLQNLEEQGWDIGGEPSGHILTLDKSTTGDAIITALQVLKVMFEQKQQLSELVQDYRPFPNTLENVRVKTMFEPTDVPALAEQFAHVEQQLQGRGRILIRKSGTEPVIRVMVEGDDAEQVRLFAKQLADAVKAHSETL